MKTKKTITYTEEELEIIQTALDEYAHSYKSMFNENPDDFDEDEINRIYNRIMTIADDFELSSPASSVMLTVISD